MKLDWRLDPSSRELVHGGRRVRLSEKPFRVLEALLEARGGVVTREALRKRLWSEGTFVDFENSLNSAVASLRQALGDSARAPRFIETIPKVGYRLVLAPVPGRSRRLLLAAAIAVLTVAATFFLHEPEPPIAEDARAEVERGLYLRGQFESGTQESSLLSRALQSFRDARRMDPRFAAAAAEEAETLVQMSFAGVVGFREGLEQAAGAAEDALALAPANGTALRARGMSALFLDWDVERASDLLDRASAADSKDARTALAEAALLAVEKRYDEAVRAAERAVALDPKALYVRADLALFYLCAGRNEDAAESTRRVLSVAPDFTPALSYGVLAYERLGKLQHAADAARELMRLRGARDEELARLDAADPHEALGLWRQWDLERVAKLSSGKVDRFALSLALRYAAAGEHGAALEHLERAYRHREALLIFLPAFPELAGLHGDPRFEELSRRLRRS
jgi:tetratricopeptide (TPR) repeat protein